MVTFVCDRLGGIQQAPCSASARRAEAVSTGYLSVDCSHGRRVSFDGRAACWATVKSPCSEIRPDHEHCCDQLCHERFDCWKNCEPKSHPSRDVCFKKRDRRGGNPLRALHFLSLLANHHKQHHAQQNAG